MTTDCKSLTRDLEIEADACVIGSGAGGGAAAKALAEGGMGVAIIEEGGFHGRDEFTGNPSEMLRLLYRDSGASVAFGPAPVPVPLGKCVGGTTTINAATCFRLPERVKNDWRERFGLELIGAGALDPVFEELEKFLNVAPVPEEHLGEHGRLLRKGCEELGWKGGVIRRNVRNCKGCGICIYGCPEDAKLSANISFIPAALAAGAQLYSNCKAKTILAKGGEVAGVEAEGGGRRVSVQAPVVVLSAGAIYSPYILKKSRLANSSGCVGRHLSLHAASRAIGVFPREVAMWRGVLQPYYVDEFFDEGIMIEAVTVPPGLLSPALHFFGEEEKRVMSLYPRMAIAGGMVHDTPCGVVHLGLVDAPLVTYVPARKDLEKIRRAVCVMAELLLAAGAVEVFTGIHGAAVLRSKADIKRLSEMRFLARDVELMSMHPQGGCRMGASSSTSVVGEELETHDVKGLYVCDASVYPTPVGVNPQFTAMALATFAAREILKK